nr:hypothetical protein [Paracoccus saliphilus]
MSDAILTLEGGSQVVGKITASGGDYIRIRAITEMTQDQLGQYGEGQIDIDGKQERVLLESAMSSADDEEVIELTLRRITPPA